MRFLKAVEVAQSHSTLERVSRKWERFDAELAAACFRFATGKTLRKLKMYRTSLQKLGRDVPGRAALWCILQDYAVEAARCSRWGYRG